MQYVVIDIPHYKKAAGIDPSEKKFRTQKKTFFDRVPRLFCRHTKTPSSKTPVTTDLMPFAYVYPDRSDPSHMARANMATEP